MSLPFENTDVPVSRSQDAIKDLLYNVGFEAIADFSDRAGRRVIRAEFGPNGQRAVFQFESNIEKILKGFKARGRSKSEQERREKANRMAWRALYFSVKSIHDQIKLGSIEIAEAFAGQMLLTDKQGNQMKVGDMLITGLSEGKLAPGKTFLLEEAK